MFHCYLVTLSAKVVLKAAATEGRTSVIGEMSVEERQAEDRKGGALPLEWDSHEVTAKPRHSFGDSEVVATLTSLMQEQLDEWAEERPSAARGGAMPHEWDSNEVKEKVSTNITLTN